MEEMSGSIGNRDSVDEKVILIRQAESILPKLKRMIVIKQEQLPIPINAYEEQARVVMFHNIRLDQEYRTIFEGIMDTLITLNREIDHDELDRLIDERFQDVGERQRQEQEFLMRHRPMRLAMKLILVAWDGNVEDVNRLSDW